MPRPRKCDCDKDTCYTCCNRHNWERWIAKKRGFSPEVSDADLDRRALEMEKRWSA